MKSIPADQPFDALFPIDDLLAEIDVVVRTGRQLLAMHSERSSRAFIRSMANLDALFNPTHQSYDWLISAGWKEPSSGTSADRLFWSSYENLRSGWLALVQVIGWQGQVGGDWLSIPETNAETKAMGGVLDWLALHLEDCRVASQNEGFNFERLKQQIQEATTNLEDNKNLNPGYFGLIMDQGRRIVTRTGFDAEINFTNSPIVWDLLAILVRKRGNIAEYMELTEREDEMGIEQKTLTGHISKLRALIKPLGLNIESARNVGYRLISKPVDNQ